MVNELRKVGPLLHLQGEAQRSAKGQESRNILSNHNRAALSPKMCGQTLHGLPIERESRGY